MIPIIDYGPYFAGAPGALERVAVDVAHACENVGFFNAPNHGVSNDTIEQAFAVALGLAADYFAPYFVTKPTPIHVFCTIRRRIPSKTIPSDRRRTPTKAS